MDQAISYAEILTRVVRAEGKYQPKHGPAIVSVCDQETGQFMLVAVGWQNGRHFDSILFHAQLVDGVVTIETDMTEEGLKPLLIEAGIREEDIQSISFRAQQENDQIAA
ncbi:MAG TPA: element excision factor XisI family protein [Blastocatellia bacterium]|nr:element excision factor XisI family protein [Blastocatellia bacterium]